MSSTSRLRAEAAAWSRFEGEAPDLASVGRRLFEKHEIAYLATVSGQGRPRIHPLCPHLLYEFRIERALWTLWENFQKPGMRPVYGRWRA